MSLVECDWRGTWCSGYSCLLGKLAIPGSNPALVFKLQRTKMFSLLVGPIYIYYCGEPLWPSSISRGEPSDNQGSNFVSCVMRPVLSHSFLHPQQVLLVQFSLYVVKGGLKYVHYISCRVWPSVPTTNVELVQKLVLFLIRILCGHDLITIPFDQLGPFMANLWTTNKNYRVHISTHIIYPRSLQRGRKVSSLFWRQIWYNIHILIEFCIYCGLSN